jgi:hypothetical protein
LSWPMKGPQCIFLANERLELHLSTFPCLFNIYIYLFDSSDLFCPLTRKK